MVSETEKRIHDGMPGYIEALKRLVRIPSISFDNFDQKFVLESAEAVKAMFTDAGYTNVLHEERVAAEKAAVED